LQKQNKMVQLWSKMLKESNPDISSISIKLV
jgi:hypothetical protein